MIGRNKNWSGPSDWIKEFNKKHNPTSSYGKSKSNKRVAKGVEVLKFRYKIFRQQD